MHTSWIVSLKSMDVSFWGVERLHAFFWGVKIVLEYLKVKESSHHESVLDLLCWGISSFEAARLSCWVSDRLTGFIFSAKGNIYTSTLKLLINENLDQNIPITWEIGIQSWTGTGLSSESIPCPGIEQWCIWIWSWICTWLLGLVPFWVHSEVMLLKFPDAASNCWWPLQLEFQLKPGHLHQCVHFVCTNRYPEAQNHFFMSKHKSVPYGLSPCLMWLGGPRKY